MRHIIPISGKDSLATAIVQMHRAPSLPYEFLFCDVAMELPETYAWLDNVERRLGIEIVRIGKSLEQVIAEQNMLPSAHRRFCTKYGKIFPIRDYLGDDDATQYIGIRADEDRVGGTFPDNITPIYPLVECGWKLEEVYNLLESRGFTPPSFFWQRMKDAVTSRCDRETLRLLSQDIPWWRHDELFAWRSRSNCYMCFYQRRYEWVGLLEHHPRLFDRAEAIENRYGRIHNNETRVKDFYWSKDLPLSLIRERSGQIFDNRAKVILKTLQEMQQGLLFPVHEPLALTSCGIYCGK